MILSVDERPHAPLSPSSFERISACTMSYELVRVSPGRRRVAGPDSLLGTSAHRLLEHGLRGGPLDRIEAVRVEGQRIDVDAAMREAVGVALTWIGANLAGRELLVEHHVALPWGKVSGWLDAASAGPPWHVIDFKHGYGVVPADTSQLGLYALALILERDRTVEGDGEARATVIQPKAPTEPVRSHTWTYTALRSLRDRLIATLDRIRRQDFTYAVGSWCRWCPCAASCPALAATARDSIAAKLAAPELVSSGEFGRDRLDAALEMTPALDHWIRQVHKTAEAYVLGGGKLKAYKLVQKPRGGLTVVSRTDQRPEIYLSETLKAALQSSIADGYLTAAKKSVTPKLRTVK